MKVVMIALILLGLTACSSKRVMKDCQPLAQNYWECEKP